MSLIFLCANGIAFALLADSNNAVVQPVTETAPEATSEKLSQATEETQKPTQAGSVLEKSKEFVSLLIELAKASKVEVKDEEHKKQSDLLISKLSDGVDFEALAKKSLGNRWDSLAQETRTNFMDTLRETIETVLYPRAHRISTPLNQVDFRLNENNNNQVLAKTRFEVERDGEIIDRDLEFELVFDPNSKKIIDAWIEGELISINLKRQFDQALEKRTFEEILAQMRRRLNQAQGKEEPAA